VQSSCYVRMGLKTSDSTDAPVVAASTNIAKRMTNFNSPLFLFRKFQALAASRWRAT
jgi:hypothetical protein